MLTKHLAHRLPLAMAAALGVVVLYGLTAPGGSQAQTPPVPTATTTPNAAATQTAVAAAQQLALQQQVPATATPSTIPNLAATATYIAAITQAQVAASATPIPTATAINTVTPVASAVTTQATTTAPSGATAQDACALPLATASGGQTIEFEQVALTLPSGNFLYGFIRPEGGAVPQVVVCNSQTASTIYIDARSGSETARRANGDAGTNSLNQIRAGVRTRGATPVSIAPPNTGDAGLR